jgi:hypothetical protein
LFLIQSNHRIGRKAGARCVCKPYRSSRQVIPNPLHHAHPALISSGENQFIITPHNSSGSFVMI